MVGIITFAQISGDSKHSADLHIGFVPFDAEGKAAQELFIFCRETDRADAIYCDAKYSASRSAATMPVTMPPTL